MESRAKILNDYIRFLDSSLVARGEGERVNLYRKTRTLVPFEYQGQAYAYAKDTLSLVFSLSEDWTLRTPPRNWGIDKVLNRIRECDLWNADSPVSNIQKQQEKVDESAERARKNTFEAVASEYRSTFKKAFSEINTSTLDKNFKTRR